MHRSLAVLAALLLPVAACGGDDSGDAAGNDKSSDTPPACAEIYAEGAIVAADALQTGCVDDSGSVLVANSVDCADGSVLVTYEESDPQLWGFVGKPLTAAEGGENASDPAYGEAYSTC